MDDSGDQRLCGSGVRTPEIPRDPLEFLSRSWSVSALEVSKAVVGPLGTAGPIPEDCGGAAGELEEVAGNPFSFAASATSQLVLERIMSQSEVSPMTSSGRLSHSSGPLNGGQSGGGSLTDSPPVSPSDVEDVKYCRSIPVGKAQQCPNTYRSKTVGRWLKDRRERKKEEARAHNAQLHAAVSVAGVAAAVAAVAAATAASSSSASDRAARADMAVASAATLVAAQCVEAAEALGAERDHLAAVVASAVSVRTPGDVATLTAAAATALRGAATLRARALKEVWNVAAVIPVGKSGGNDQRNNHQQQHLEGRRNSEGDEKADLSGELAPENFLGLCSQELLARGSELLKRTRKGALHWKQVSVYINQSGQVMLKTKSRHVAGTITKKKKSVVIEICKDVPAWPGRHLLHGGEQRRYFGLRTAERRVVEFECTSQREYEMWTKGVARLLSIVVGGGGRRGERNGLIY